MQVLYATDPTIYYANLSPIWKIYYVQIELFELKSTINNFIIWLSWPLVTSCYALNVPMLPYWRRTNIILYTIYSVSYPATRLMLLLLLNYCMSQLYTASPSHYITGLLKYFEYTSKRFSRIHMHIAPKSHRHSYT